MMLLLTLLRLEWLIKPVPGERHAHHFGLARLKLGNSGTKTLQIR